MRSLLIVAFLFCYTFCLGQKQEHKSRSFWRKFRADSTGMKNFRYKHVEDDTSRINAKVGGISLIGYTKNQVLKLLGKPSVQCPRGSVPDALDYFLTPYDCPAEDEPGIRYVLELHFVNDTVQKAYTSFIGTAHNHTVKEPFNVETHVLGDYVATPAPPRPTKIELQFIMLGIIRNNDTLNKVPMDSVILKKDSLDKYIMDHIHYPEVEKEAEIMGTVFASFIVEKDGSVTNVKILKGVTGGPGLDKEVVRTLLTVPKLHPHKVKGYPVRAIYGVVVRFEMQ
jgi:TonB family protein